VVILLRCLLSQILSVQVPMDLTGFFPMIAQECSWIF